MNQGLKWRYLPILILTQCVKYYSRQFYMAIYHMFVLFVFFIFCWDFIFHYVAIWYYVIFFSFLIIITKPLNIKLVTCIIKFVKSLSWTKQRKLPLISTLRQSCRILKSISAWEFQIELKVSLLVVPFEVSECIPDLLHGNKHVLLCTEQLQNDIV